MIEALTYITLFVTNLEASLRWYRDGLGLQVVDESPRFVRLSAGNCQIGLHAAAEDRGSGTVNLHFRVADVDRACTDLAARGIACVQGPRNQPWGMRVANFTDPAGYTVELVAPLP